MAKTTADIIKDLRVSGEKIRRRIAVPGDIRPFKEGLAEFTRALDAYPKDQSLPITWNREGVIYPVAMLLANRVKEKRPPGMRRQVMEECRAEIMGAVAALIPVIIRNVAPKELKAENDFVEVLRWLKTGTARSEAAWKQFYDVTAGLSRADLVRRLNQEYDRRQQQSAPVAEAGSPLPTRNPKLFEKLAPLGADAFERLCRNTADECREYLRRSARTSTLEVLNSLRDLHDPETDAMVRKMENLCDYAAKAYHDNAPINPQAISAIAALPVEKMNERVARAFLSALNAMVMVRPQTLADYPRLIEVLATVNAGRDRDLAELAQKYAADWQGWSGVAINLNGLHQKYAKGAGRGTYQGRG